MTKISFIVVAYNAAQSLDALLGDLLSQTIAPEQLEALLSFGFYIPVVLWADAVPMIGMLMIPKTCAYVWTVLIGFFAMKKECR